MAAFRPNVAGKTLHAAEGWHDPNIDLGLAEGGYIRRERYMRRLHQLATPNANPFTAAMIGFGKDSTRHVI